LKAAGKKRLAKKKKLANEKKGEKAIINGKEN
jgi:hypothetical protein